MALSGINDNDHHKPQQIYKNMKLTLFPQVKYLNDSNKLVKMVILQRYLKNRLTLYFAQIYETADCHFTSNFCKLFLQLHYNRNFFFC